MLRTVSPLVEGVGDDFHDSERAGRRSYRDDGCAVSPSCLTCPLAVCIEDQRTAAQEKREDAAQRDVGIYNDHARGLNVSAVANRYGVSRRTVNRACARLATEVLALRSRGDSVSSIMARLGVGYEGVMYAIEKAAAAARPRVPVAARPEKPAQPKYPEPDGGRWGGRRPMPEEERARRWAVCREEYLAGRSIKAIVMAHHWDNALVRAAVRDLPGNPHVFPLRGRVRSAQHRNRG